MSAAAEFAIRSILIGAGATLVMDSWGFFLSRVFGIHPLNYALLGRWIGHLPRGRWSHESIAQSPPVTGERWIGWAAHYSIGIAFAGLLLAAFGLDWARTPTILPALVIGIVTVLAPWLVLQPAMGAGIASSRTPRPVFNALKSLVTHVVYGCGLYVAALATASLLP